MTEKRGGGYGPVGEQGDTDLDVSLVDNVLLLESIDGDLGASNEKFSSNIVSVMLLGVVVVGLTPVRILEVGNPQ